MTESGEQTGEDAWFEAAHREVDDALEDAGVFYRTPFPQVMQVVSMHAARMYRILVQSQRLDDERSDDIVSEVGMVLDMLREQIGILAVTRSEDVEL